MKVPAAIMFRGALYHRVITRSAAQEPEPISKYAVPADRAFLLTAEEIEALPRTRYDPYNRAANNRDMFQDWLDADSGLRPDALAMLEKYNTLVNEALAILRTKAGDTPFWYKANTLASDFFEWPTNFEEFGKWPVTVYVSGSNLLQDCPIGIEVFENGTIKEFEGCDEASAATYDLVDKLLGQDVEVQVWGAHAEDVALKIKETKIAPANLYVSPDRDYARGYLDLEGTRNLVSFKLMKSNMARESEMDWRIKQDTPVKQVHIY